MYATNKLNMLGLRRNWTRCITAFQTEFNVNIFLCACTVFSHVSTHGRLKLTGQEMGVGTYTDKPFVCITHIYVNHRITKKGGVGAYMEMVTYSREYGMFILLLQILWA